MKLTKHAAWLALLVLIFYSNSVLAISNQEITDDILFAIGESSGISVTQFGDAVMLTGSVPSIEKKTLAAEVATNFKSNIINNLEIVNAEQIKISVEIIEIDKDKLDDLGIQFGTTTLTGFKEGQGIVNSRYGQFKDTAIGYADLQAKINLLYRDGYADVMANPTIITSNGTSAYVRVGGSLPIPKGTGQNYGIEWKDYGVKLTITPRYTPEHTILTDVNCEIVDIDPLSLSNKVVMGDDASIPIFRRDTARATLNLRQHETMALGGLVSYEFNDNNDNVWGLSNIPLIGGLFKNNSKRHTSVDMLILITPETVFAGNSIESQGEKFIDKWSKSDLEKAQIDINNK